MYLSWIQTFNEGNNLYCDQLGACNYNELGTCIFPEKEIIIVKVHGSVITVLQIQKKVLVIQDQEHTAGFPGQKDDRNAPADDRVDCDGNPLYCTDPAACNYDGENGECIYHGSRRLCR